MAKKAKRRKLTTKQGTFIDPERLYTMRGFMKCAGLSLTRMTDARIDHGVKLETIDVGQLRYVSGVAGIDYIKRLSAAMADRKAPDG